MSDFPAGADRAYTEFELREAAREYERLNGRRATVRYLRGMINDLNGRAPKWAPQPRERQEVRP